MRILVFICMVVISQAAWSVDRIFQKNGVAINGYDVVAYFTASTAVQGNTKHSYTWQEVSWQFSSAENRDKFAMDPERYAPQYGGYCAYAMSKGSYAPTDPNAWTVHNDKLYLNYSLQVRQLWQQDLENNITLADKNWARL